MTTTTPLAGASIEPENGAASHIQKVVLDEKAFPYLADHRLQDLAVVPGGLYVEMALAAVAALRGERPRHLEAVSFQRVCVVPTGEACLLQVVLAPENEGVLHVCVERAPKEGRAANSSGHVHARMNVVGAEMDPGCSPPDPAPLATLRARGAASISGAAFYDALREAGNQYGLAFQGVVEVWRDQEEAVGALRVPPGLNAADGARHLHPALLDAAVQVLTALGRSPGDTPILTGVDQIHLYDAPGPPRWVHARRVPDPEAQPGVLAGDVHLFNASEQPVAALRGVRFRYLARAGVISAAADPAPRTIAVTATFTAEPLEESLAFWMETFGTPATVRFAPYNQPFQQLLDPNSLLARNRDGVNVVLLRLEDWLGEDGPAQDDLRLTPPDPREQERSPAELPHYTLPNGLEIAHLNPYETAYLYDEIFVNRVYLKYGITLPDGACVIDVGANVGLFTLFVLQQVRDAAVYAFEPAPPAFKALSVNAARYGTTVKVFDRGLSDREGEAPFIFYPQSSVFSGFHADEEEDRAALQAVVRNVLRKTHPDEDVAALVDPMIAGRLVPETAMRPVQTLSSVIREQHIEQIDLLKIDAERSELEVLGGIDDEDWGRIRQIVLEVHDRTGTLLDEVMRLLEARGFQVVVDEEALLRDAGLAQVYGRRPDVPTRTDVPWRFGGWEALSQNVEDLAQAVRAAQQRAAAQHLVCVCPASPAARADAGTSRCLQQAEQRLAEALDGLRAVHLIGSETVRTAYPVADADAPHADALGHVPYTRRFFTALGTLVARACQGLWRAPYKVIVLDADQTLWKGICGEDGPRGVVVDPPRAALQAFMVQQHDAGMLLCLCSKNNEEDVLAVFEQHPEMPLRSDHFVAWRVNWKPKSENIRSLAEALNLGLDSFIFIDDDPVACAEVQARCPEVLTLPLPRQPEAIPTFLANVWAFDHLQVTREDRHRTYRYRQVLQREEARAASLTFRAFLEGLDLQVRIEVPVASQFARLAQLTQRTNQFNTTAHRRSEAEIRSLLQGGALEGFVVEVSDRFGAYGLVGAVLFGASAGILIVDTFVLSCRALGKGVEHRMLAYLGEVAQARGLGRVEVPYRATGKNQPALDFLKAATASSDEGAGRKPGVLEREDGFLFTFPAAVAAAITFDPVEQGHSAMPPSESRPLPAIETRESPAFQSRQAALLLHRIATELQDVDQILDALTAKAWRPRPRRAGAFVPPDNEVERTIAQIWQEVLGVEQVGLDDPFFDLGGTSLKAVEVIVRLCQAYDVELSVLQLFDKTTVRALAGMLKADDDAWTQKSTARRRRGEQRRAQSATRRRYQGKNA